MTAPDQPAPAAAPDPGAPARYAVLGHPVAHSQSPFIHAAFARQTGQHLAYGRLDCPPADFVARLRGFAEGQLLATDDGRPAGAPVGRAGGCNITVPLKFEVLPLAARATPRAALAQAANTLRFDAEGGWLADNTDGIGLVRDIGHAGFTLSGRRVLLIGAGGAAAGVLGPLLQAGPAEVVVANRSADRADALVRRHAGCADAARVRLSAAALSGAGRGFDLVINGTASSLAGAGVPVAPEVLAPGALAIDLMYGAAAAPFLRWAQAHGAQGRDGLGMLVEQAAESFALWRGVMPDTAPVLAALRQRLQAAG